APERNVALRVHQHDVAVSQHHAQGEHLGKEVRDLAGREVDHRQHQLPHKIGLFVVLRDLRARRFHAELTEVDAQLVGGLARFGEVVDLHDPADADVDLGEVVPGNGWHAGSVRSGSMKSKPVDSFHLDTVQTA